MIYFNILSKQLHSFRRVRKIAKNDF